VTPVVAHPYDADQIDREAITEGRTAPEVANAYLVCLSNLERKATRAIAEARETYALTDATHSRSTSRRKSKAVEANDWAFARGLCEAICCFSDDITSTAVWMRLEARIPR
jgi:hypothetical protein